MSTQSVTLSRTKSLADGGETVASFIIMGLPSDSQSSLLSSFSPVSGGMGLERWLSGLPGFSSRPSRGSSRPSQFQVRGSWHPHLASAPNTQGAFLLLPNTHIHKLRINTSLRWMERLWQSRLEEDGPHGGRPSPGTFRFMSSCPSGPASGALQPCYSSSKLWPPALPDTVNNAASVQL